MTGATAILAGLSATSHGHGRVYLIIEVTVIAVLLQSGTEPRKQYHFMSTDILLKQSIDAEKENYPSGINDGEVFEIFCADNILKNFDLSFDQVTNGIIDGPHDGGIDGVYVFVNKQLIEEDTDLSAFKNPVDIEVIIIQSKHQDSFKEAAVDKLSSSLPMLFDLAKPTASLMETYNKFVIEAFGRYRDVIGKLSKQFPTIRVEIFYCSKGDVPTPE